ncbi:ALP1 [Symbiodinium necroappetens]|uniref:ALP1 protein n=1 Tax=Symbiodinium necroappetens TaxID=1628268 RepID=A0A813ACJ9_9DINO|nr:ALP1 [Symbiodinium necroappetens]
MGPAYTFWDLHRMLADCYSADVAEQRWQPEHSKSRHYNRQHSAGPDAHGVRFADLPPRRDLSRRSSHSHHSQERTPPVNCHPNPPEEACSTLARLQKGRTKDSLHNLLNLHGFEADSKESEEIDMTNFQLKAHACWQSDVQLKKAGTTTQRSRKSASMSVLSSNASMHISSPVTEGDMESTASSRFILHPSGTFRSCWNVWIGILVLYDLLVIPLLVFTLPPWINNFLGLRSLQLFWIADFVITFFTGYYSRGLLVLDRCKVAQQYARTWMCFDLGLLCVDWFINILDLSAADSPETWSQTVRMLRLLRLLRILRAVKLRRGFLAVQDLLHSQAASLYLSFFFSFFELLILNHWVACAWFGVHWLNSSENWVLASGLDDRDAVFQYLSCLLWAFCQLGVGESPLLPTNKMEMVLNSVVGFRSLVTSATLISSGLIAGLRKLREDEISEFRLLRRYLQQNSIPHALGQKVTQFLQHQYAERQHERSLHMHVPLLSLLSRLMYQELQFERHRVALSKIGVVRELLEGDEVHCLHTLHQMASESLAPILGAAGDSIFLSGHVAKSSFLMMTGRLCYYRDDSSEILDDTRWVAEMCLWAPWVHMGDLEAQDTSELLSLDADGFCATLGHNWETQRAASRYARRFVDAVQMLGCPCCFSDAVEAHGCKDAISSGSPVFDADGKVIAMVAKKFEEHGLAIPAERLRIVIQCLEEPDSLPASARGSVSAKIASIRAQTMIRIFASLLIFCSSAAAGADLCEADQSQLLQRQRARSALKADDVPYTLHDLGGKSVYLVMTDRFSRFGGVSQNDSNPCAGNNWCNGTLKGITSQLEYIRDMGFDCIWVTPVVLNFYGPDGPSGWGYHGYWAQDYYRIDPNFGTKEDLKELVEQTHNMGMCFILDIVLNHCRPVHSERDLSEVNPFNVTSYVHQLNISNLTFDQYTEKMSGWPPPAQALGPGASCELQFFPNGTPDSTNNGTYCNNYPGNVYNAQTYLGDRAHGPPDLKYCGAGNYICRGYNETVNIIGWFYDLADLNQTVPFVRQGLKDWVMYMVTEYAVDGIRLDTTPYMTHEFLQEVQEMLHALDNPIHILGEVTSTNLSFHASYQVQDGKDVLAGLENFPLTYMAMPGYCGWPNGPKSPVAQFDLTYLASEMIRQQRSGLYKDLNLLMNMMDNQDETPIWGQYHIPGGGEVAEIFPRRSEDWEEFAVFGGGGCFGYPVLVRNAWAWLLFAKGMPVVTWGDEQGNSAYRNSLWQFNWNKTSSPYQLLHKMNAIRRSRNVAKASQQIHLLYRSRLVFSRGCGLDQVFVLTNNLVLAEGQRVGYWFRLPRPPRGMMWRDALRDQYFYRAWWRVMTWTTEPLVLVLVPLGPLGATQKSVETQ